MNTNQLIHLLPDMATYAAVVETGSFTKAAQKLAITPSAVSRQITRLEESLSLVLLERTTRKQAMSESGRLVYEHCKAMLDSARNAAAISDASIEEPSGYLRVAAPKAFAKQILDPLIASFLECYPLIKLRVKVTDKLLDPVKDEVDVIFRLAEKPIDNLICKPIGTVASVLCASPEYLALNPAPQHPSDLQSHQCLHLGESALDNQWQFSQGTQTVKVKVNSRYAVNHTEMRLNGIKNGFGVGILPDFTAKQAINDGQVVRVLSDWNVEGNYQGEAHMQYSQNRFMPRRVRVFIDYMQDTVKQGSIF